MWWMTWQALPVRFYLAVEHVEALQHVHVGASLQVHLVQANRTGGFDLSPHDFQRGEKLDPRRRRGAGPHLSIRVSLTSASVW
jgi:hypothetical protein